jgi:hypothetical protein
MYQLTNQVNYNPKMVQETNLLLAQSSVTRLGLEVTIREVLN